MFLREKLHKKLSNFYMISMKQKKIKKQYLSLKNLMMAEFQSITVNLKIFYILIEIENKKKKIKKKNQKKIKVRIHIQKLNLNKLKKI